MGILRAYARLILFAAGVLIGVQVPSFVDQYFKRVSAHRLEAMANFRGFEQTAALHFQGDVLALIAHYETSPDPVFREDATTIRAIHNRIRRHSVELEHLESPLILQVVHVAFSADPEIFRDTVTEYSATVPLNQSAILCGLVAGFFAALFFELGLLGLAGMVMLGWRGLTRKSAYGH